MSEQLEAEVVAIAPIERGNLFQAKTGADLVTQATERATALADVVRKQRLSVTISGREHVRVEGWTLLGSMLGVFPVASDVSELRDKDGVLLGFEARVEARTLEGKVVGAAVSRCMKSENTWKNRDDYALMSMAQTRATSKALRMPLGFVMSLAGFDPTPADEMPSTKDEPKSTEPTERDRRNAAYRRIKELTQGDQAPLSADQMKSILEGCGVMEGLEKASIDLVESVVRAAEDVAAGIAEGQVTEVKADEPASKADLSRITKAKKELDVSDALEAFVLATVWDTDAESFTKATASAWLELLLDEARLSEQRQAYEAQA